MGKFKDLTGQKFGRLTVLERVENAKCGKVRWLCRCDCGNEVIVNGSSLTSQNTKSCGCFHKELISQLVTTHGMTRTKIYSVWCSIKDRCYNENCKNHPQYGGRGIKMCDRWKDSFENFYEDVSKMEHFNERGYSLDRIDNNGDYCPENVRWADRKTQQRNTRANVKVEYEGVQMCLIEAAEKSGINYRTLQRRYYAGDRGDKLFRPVEK